MEKNSMTAVEWLMNELANTGLLVTKDIDNLVAYSKAKQIEKEQIISSFSIGDNCGYNFAINEDNQKFDSGEQYYNETYGGAK